MSTISAVQFPGTLSITDENFSGYEAYDIKDSSFAILDNINFYNTTLNRAGTTPTVNSNITYYIQVTTDINKDISFSTVPVGANNTFDDVWSLSGLSFNDGISHIIDVSYNLPQINDVHVNVTKVHAYMSNDLSANSTFEYRYSHPDEEYTSSSDASGAHLGRILDLDIVFSSTSIGQFLTETKYYDYSGSGFEVRVPEKIDFAQVVDIGDFGPYIKDTAAPTDTSTDILVRYFNAWMLNNLTSGDVYVKRTAINSLTITITFTNLGQLVSLLRCSISSCRYLYSNYFYARYNDWTTTDYGFYAGDRIVASNSHSLSLDMLDSSNNTISLVTGTVYGVIRQDVSGART